ncbi:hypothetical protein GCM10027446_25000 [Angustibacter peucedani]
MSLAEQTQVAGLGTTHGLRTARVNLLPPEIEQARALKRTQAGLAVGLAAVVAALGGVYALQVHDKNAASDELAVTKAQTVTLQNEQAKYADVPLTIAAIDAAEAARSTAMANDVEWYRTLNNFALTLPTNVWFTSLTLNLNAAGSVPAAGATAPTAGTTGTAATAAPAGAGIGVLTVNGAALSHPDVATWLDVVGRQPGMADAYFTNSARAKVGSKYIVNFVSTATITDEALSHRYDRKQG